MTEFNNKGELYGKWRGEIVNLSGSAVSASISSGTVECLISQYSATDNGSSALPPSTEGYLWVTTEGNFGGSEGMVISWRVLSLLTIEKNRKDWAVDLTFPPSLSLEPIPAIMNFENNRIEMALPLSDLKKRPTSYDGENNQLIPIMTLAKITEEEVPKPIKEYKLGTSLKHVAMNVVKEVKKLLFDVLPPQRNSKAKKTVGNGRSKIVFRMWHIKFVVNVDQEPFWTLIKLRIGISKIFSNVPSLLPGGDMCEPVYLAQAIEDEKDGRLRERLEDTLEELTTKFGEVDFQHSNVGLQDLLMSSQDEVVWSVAYSGAGAEPFSAYLLSEPNKDTLARLHTDYQNRDTRPIRVCDVKRSSVRGVGGVDDVVEDEDTSDYAVKGKRGKLIMAAERNKKALEDGTYGKSSSAEYDAGPSQRLGAGDVAGSAPVGATVSEVRLLKLSVGNGRTLCDERVSHVEKEAAEVMKRRNERLQANDKSKVRDIRKARMQININTKLSGGNFTTNSEGNSATSPTSSGGINFLKLNVIRDKRNVLTKELQSKFDHDDFTMFDLMVNKELVVDHEKMIQGRKRKIIDFLHLSKGKKQATTKEDISLTNETTLPIVSSSTSTTSKKKEMSEEEKEMLAILKGINTSNPNKFEVQSNSENNEGEYEEITKVRPKIRDCSKTVEIAAMRVEVLNSHL